MKIKLGDIIDKIVGNEDRMTTKRKFYVAGEHIETSKLMVKKCGLLNEKTKNTLGYQFHYPFEKGDILFMTKNPYLKKCGLVDFDGICSIATFVIRTKDESLVRQKFLAILMQTDNFWNYLEANKSGSVNYFITWKTLEKYTFELPDVDTQDKIINFVWSINDNIESYEEMIVQSDELIKAKFIEMFDDSAMERKRLDEICRVFADGDWIESKDQSQDGIWLVQTGNVGNGEFKPKADKKHYISEETFERLNCTEIFEGDVLISRLPDPVGRACLVPKLEEKCITVVDCTIIRLKEFVDSRYFVEYTKTQDYYNQLEITGSTRQRVSRKNLGKVLVPVPSIDSQVNYRYFCEQIDDSKVLIEDNIKKLGLILKSLLIDFFEKEAN